MDERIRAALARGQRIDITTLGRRSRQPRRIELRCHTVDLSTNGAKLKPPTVKQPVKAEGWADGPPLGSVTVKHCVGCGVVPELISVPLCEKQSAPSEPAETLNALPEMASGALTSLSA